MEPRLEALVDHVQAAPRERHAPERAPVFFHEPLLAQPALLLDELVNEVPDALERVHAAARHLLQLRDLRARLRDRHAHVLRREPLELLHAQRVEPTVHLSVSHRSQEPFGVRGRRRRAVDDRLHRVRAALAHGVGEQGRLERLAVLHGLRHGLPQPFRGVPREPLLVHAARGELVDEMPSVFAPAFVQAGREHASQQPDLDVRLARFHLFRSSTLHFPLYILHFTMTRRS